MRDKNLVVRYFHIRIKIGMSKDYCKKNLLNIICTRVEHMTVLENANARDFDDTVKCDIFKAQMGGKYLPVPAQDPYNGNANINSPATLRAWMRSHYQRETVGSQ